MHTFLLRPLPILSIGIFGNGVHGLTGNDGKISSKGFPSDFLSLRELLVVLTILSMSFFWVFVSSSVSFVAVLTSTFSFSLLDCTSCFSCYLKKNYDITILENFVQFVIITLYTYLFKKSSYSRVLIYNTTSTFFNLCFRSCMVGYMIW